MLAGPLSQVSKTEGVYWGPIGVLLGLYRDNGKENGSYRSIFGYPVLQDPNDQERRLSISFGMSMGELTVGQ